MPANVGASYHSHYWDILQNDILFSLYFAIFAIWEKLQNLILAKSKNLYKSIKITKLNTSEIWLMDEGPFWSKS